jgi:CDP-ribitol ribitolphosphotransferase
MAEISTERLLALLLPWSAADYGIFPPASLVEVPAAVGRYDRAVVEPEARIDDGRGPDLVVAGVRWERIQLVVTVRHASSTTAPMPPAESFFLRSVERPAARLEALRLRGDAADVRFNVFAGPDRMPLDPGRWQLMIRTQGGEPATTVACEPSVIESANGDREFVHPAWTIRVTPVSVAGMFAIGLAVRHTGTTERSASIPGAWRRLKRAVRVGTFRITVGLVRLVPRGRRLIVFTSDSRATLGGNLKLVHDRMVERGLDRTTHLRSILKPSVRTRRSMLDRWRLAWLLARADVILLDDYQPAIYQLGLNPDVRVIQLWHAWGAFKTVGYSRIGKPGGPNPYSSVHKNYTFATVSSAHEVPFYAEAFGLPEASVVPTGTPRMDQFLDPRNQEAGRERALSAFPAARGRRVILFAPTFRGDGATQAQYPMEVLDLPALHALATELDAVVILKMHPFVDARLTLEPSQADRLLDASGSTIDVNDLLLIADVLVTDYSSLIFEYAALGRPMLFFAFDLDEYVASRDFYEPFASFAPGRIVRTFPDLLDALRRGEFEQEKVEPFARDHLPSETGSATDRIIDQLILAP